MKEEVKQGKINYTLGKNFSQKEKGLEVSGAALFVQEASKYDSRIEVVTGGGSKKVNAKSIMGMMSLGLTDGDELEILVSGTDADEAVAGIESFLKSRA